MKIRYLSIVPALFLVVACGGSSTPEPETAAGASETTAPAAEKPADDSAKPAEGTTDKAAGDKAATDAKK